MALKFYFQDARNCGLSMIYAVSSEYGSRDDKNLEAREKAYEELAKRIDGNELTCFLLTDNVAKQSPGRNIFFKMDPTNPTITTAGFVSWLIRHKYGKVVAGPRTVNMIHYDKQDWSVIQTWTWVTPKGLAKEEEAIKTKKIPHRFLRSITPVLLAPKKLLKTESTDW